MNHNLKQREISYHKNKDSWKLIVGGSWTGTTKCMFYLSIANQSINNGDTCIYTKKNKCLGLRISHGKGASGSVWGWGGGWAIFSTISHKLHEIEKYGSSTPLTQPPLLEPPHLCVYVFRSMSFHMSYFAPIGIWGMT